MKKLLVATLFILGLSAAAFAQANEGRNAPPRPGSLEVASVPNNADRPYSRSITGKILKVNIDQHMIVIAETKEGQVKFTLSDDTRKKADKKTELGENKNIQLSDYKPGQTIKVTYRLADGKVLEVRLKETKN